jgi:hypothetical protein
MADVLELGSLPVPKHLRNAPHGAMRQFGIGVGYRYPHDYEGADVEQQYLPDELRDRRYYRPSEVGVEIRIGERLERLRQARAESGEKPRRQGGGPEVDPMKVAAKVMRSRESEKRQTAGREQRDAVPEDRPGEDPA